MDPGAAPAPRGPTIGGSVARGAGCDDCNNTGYKSRLGYYELVRINPAMRRAISDNAPLTEMSKLVDKDFTTMREDGIQRCLEGLTTIEEVLRATQDTDEAAA